MSATFPSRPASRTRLIAANLAQLIETGVTKPGERLPSIRQAAERHGVSKNTMAEIYDRLVASGHLEARQGAGYYARAVAVALSRQRASHVAEASDLVALLREQLDQSYEVRPGDGRPPPSWMEGSELGAHLRGGRMARCGAVEFGYGSSWGFEPLRDRIGAMLGERGIRCGSDQVLLTHGANHALDLIIRFLVEPDDVVFVDDPGYYPLFGKLKLAKARMVGIRRNMDGPDLEDLKAKLAVHNPRLFFTQSLAHNPTGGSIALHVAHDILTLAGRHGFRLIEDDPFADVLPPLTPRLAAFDQLQRVIYVGTFAKTLSASLRVGYVAADLATAAALSDVKLLTTVATSDFSERLVHDLIADGQYVRHLRRLRQRIREATSEVLQEFADTDLTIAEARHGGFYLWAMLPARLDEGGLCRDAAAQGIFLAPGRVFRPDRSASTAALRLNVAHAAHPRFVAFIRDRMQNPSSCTRTDDR